MIRLHTHMWRTLSVWMVIVLYATHAQAQAPICRVDPSWPTVPNDWIFAAMAGIATDSKDNVWVIHRSAGVTMKKACCKAAPVVMQFDPSGKLLQSWDGPGNGYEWPLPNNEHGIFIDHKDNVWIAGRGATGTSENQILKFDNKGKFLLQIGRRGKGNGSNDTANLGQPADMAVYAPTNEVFVADGYGNRRIIVFDADTGAYKRHWGAYGNRPDDAAPRETRNQGPGDPQFNQVHHVRISRDGFVYVADRLNRRIQVFTVDGKFVKEAFVRRSSPEAAGTVSSLAFSPGNDQRYLYVADQAEDVILVLDRQTLTEVASCGRLGRQAGQFVSPHNIATDSKGNLYVAEDLGGARLQKFVFVSAVQALTGLPSAQSPAPVTSESARQWLGQEQRIEEHLKNAKVTSVEDLGTGVTRPRRAYLAPNEPVASLVWKVLPPGRRNGYWESYKSEIAAYELDRLLNMHMVPPAVERRIDSDTGAAVMWVSGMKSVKELGGKVPGGADWGKPIRQMLLFDNLIRNIDRNAGNMLIGSRAGDLILIDHSRAFTTDKKLQNKVERVDAELWERMQTLTRESLTRALAPWLDDAAITAIITRRDAMATEINKQIAKKGRALVLIP